MSHHTHDRQERDPGAYIGQEPELAADTIPGGVRPEDDRVAGHQREADGAPGQPQPGGHREAAASDADRREAGQDR